MGSNFAKDYEHLSKDILQCVYPERYPNLVKNESPDWIDGDVGVEVVCCCDSDMQAAQSVCRKGKCSEKNGYVTNEYGIFQLSALVPSGSFYDIEKYIQVVFSDIMKKHEKYEKYICKNKLKICDLFMYCVNGFCWKDDGLSLLDLLNLANDKLHAQNTFRYIYVFDGITDSDEIQLTVLSNVDKCYEIVDVKMLPRNIT